MLFVLLLVGWLAGLDFGFCEPFDGGMGCWVYVVGKKVCMKSELRSSLAFVCPGCLALASALLPAPASSASILHAPKCPNTVLN
jgi:hypothetical protein